MKKAEKKKSSQKNPFLHFVEKSNYLYYKIFCILLFVLIACYYTFIHNANFLIKIQELSLFLFDGIFFRECMQLPGGLLDYGGAFLIQFFYYPWQGSLIFIVLSLLVVFLFVSTYKIPNNFFSLSIIPAFMFLLTLTSLDYIIFILKSVGYVYSNLLGIIVILLCFWAYKKTPSLSIRTLILFTIAVVGYPLFGFYTLFTLLLIAIYELACYAKSKQKSHFTPLILSVILGITIPYLYFAIFYTRLSIEYIYISGLPLFFFNKAEFILWLPYIIIFVCLICFTFFLFRRSRNNRFNTPPKLSFFVYLLAIILVYIETYEDENFRTEIAMDLATFDNKWQKVIKLAEDNKNAPSRLNVMFRNLALQKQKTAGDNLFKYQHASTPSTSRRPSQYLRDIGAKPIYFQYGQINNCYRWAMEDNVEYGTKLIYLKYMVKCALLNNEYQLANKYNSAIKKTLFHKEWADKYQQYIDNPNLMDNDPEFKEIKALMAFDNILAGDAGLIENYILNSFALMEGGNKDIAEISLQNNMIQKNIERFWPRFALYIKNHDRIPIHYQEAALLFSFLEGKVSVSSIEFDPLTEANFNEFVSMSQQYANYPEETTRELFKPKFGKTYWYYYFFAKDLKTN